MHLDQELIQRLLHGELAPSTAAAVSDHVASCFDCQARVSEAEQEEAALLALLGQLDHTPPAATVDFLMRREAARHLNWGRWVAGILLALGAAGLAYAVPGLPFRGWVDGFVKSVADRGDPALSPSETAPVSDAASGIVVDPGEHLTIVFAKPRQGSYARVRLTDHSEVVVRALNGPAIFTTDIDRLLIDDYGSAAEFEIGIPHAARRVEILIGNRRVLLSEGARVTSVVPQNANGSYLLPL